MTKAKRVRGSRQTKYIPPGPVKRKFEQGRPKGTCKKYPFEQTRLGFLLKYEMPVAYGIIMQRYKDKSFPHPEAEVIELVCKASRDPTYKKPKFRRCMNEYAATGLYCKRPKLLTEGRKEYYESVRKKKMEAFIARNQKKILKYKQLLFKNDLKSVLIPNDNQ
ncbi:hypothetical protein [Bacteroides ovatus]|jgi:hypothetical protein|uniref:hypothetical protein n=1 Tax=Bacteroides ovatus TaxID=28116 RepID=UPI00206B53FA|nr:hypothetical protein [Bacteroides ovatus]UYI64259.1 MAG: hypothetical protein OGM04_02260 [Bacteroides ovatus]DAU81470.1 MAG TPA: hypothetical protein [Caudoviricetes sp.]